MKKINFIEKNDINSGNIIFNKEEERQNTADPKVNDQSKKVECLEEIKSKRETHAKYYRMSDGSIRAVYYGTPVHYYDVDSKQYEEIDNALEYTAKSTDEQDFDGYQNKRGEIKIKFAKQIGESCLMQIDKAGHKIIWRLLGQKVGNSSKREFSDYGRIENVCAVVHNAKNSDIEKKLIHKKNALINNLVQSHGEIRYNDFVKGADLQYFTKSFQLKENIIIKEQLDNYEFAFELQLKELNIRLSKNEKEVEFFILRINDEGEVQEEILYTMPPAYMIDANNTYSEDVNYEIERLGQSKYILRIQADENWINDEKRVFPIKIDPTIIYKNKKVLTCRTIQDVDESDTSGNLIVIGWPLEVNSKRQARGLVKWNLDLLQNVKVLNATLNFYQYDCASPGFDYNRVSDPDFEIRKITENWNENAILKWENLPPCGEVIDKFKYDKSLSHSDKYVLPEKPPITIDITSFIDSPYGIMIKSVMDTEPSDCHYIRLMNENYLWDVSDEYIDTAFCPYMTVTYLENRQIQSDQQFTTSVNRAGTASLDLYTQNLRFVHEDLVLEGEKPSISISHIYNSREANSLSIAPTRGNYSSGNIGMGRGWKTNFHQYLFPYEELGSEYKYEEYMTDFPKYVYIDQYGNEHVIIKTKENQNEYKYIDENGSGFEYYPTENMLKDKNGNKLYFSDYNHLLIKIEDYYGNAININFNDYNLISEITDASGRTATFIYSGLNVSSSGQANPKLTAIRHQGQDVVSFKYDSTDKLKEIVYLDGTESCFGYGGNGSNYVLSSIRDQTGYRVLYSKQENVYTIKESTNVSKIANGSIITCSEKYGNEAIITFERDRTYIETKDKKKTVHIFNLNGQSICSYVDRSNCTESGAERIEKIRCTSSEGEERVVAEVSMGAKNLILDGGFDETYAIGWTTNLSGIGDISSEDRFKGFSSYRLQGDSKTERYATKEYEVSGSPQSLVLSCFAKAKALPVLSSESERKFRIGGQICYSDGTKEEMHYADYNCYITDWQVAGVGLCKSLANRFKTISSVIVKLEYSANYGAAYFDELSLRESSFARQTLKNLYELQYGSVYFDLEDVTGIRYYQDGWKTKSTYDGSKMILTATDIQKMLTQNIREGKGSVYVGNELVTSEAEVEGSIDNILKGIYIIKKPTGSGTIENIYDLINLCKLRTKQIITQENGTDQYVQAKTDREGRLVEKTVINENGQEFTTHYTYNEAGQQISEQNWRDIRKENTYDSYGNIVKEVVRNTTQSITAERYIQDYGYTDSGNSMNKIHDGRGSAAFNAYDTEFAYSNAYGRLTSITMPDGQQINYNYNSQRNLSSISASVEGESSENSFTYTRGLVTKIVSDGSIGGSGTQANKNVYTFEYDGFGSITKIKLNGEELRRYKYYQDCKYMSENESIYNYNAVGQVRKIGTSLSDWEIAWEKTIYDSEARPICIKSYITDGNETLKGSETEKCRVEYDYYGRIDKMTDNATGTARTYNYYYKNDGSEDRVEITGEISGYLKKTTDKQGRTTNLKVEFDNSVRFYGYKYQKRYYAVEPDGRLEEVELPSGEITNYTYDKLGRVSEHRITFPGTGEQVVTGSGSSGTSVSREDYFIRERYDYQRGANNDRTTEYVSSIQYLGNGYNASTVYTYDNRGNIRSVAEGGRNISYEYDGLNRLTRENNKGMEFTKVYEYDTNGNIVKVKERGYTTAAELGTVRKTLEYKYEETGARRDRLVKITAQNENGVETEQVEISGYDNLGNPCNYKGNVVEWNQARQMIAYGSNTYKYDAEGVRTEKSENGTIHKYYWLGGELQYETRIKDGKKKTLWYYYDGSGICGIEYNGAGYYFQKNIQGDVVRIVNSKGETMATYGYDAWGNHWIKNAMGQESEDPEFIGNVNPIRYRGYYYDEGIGLYYLKSRYYDPEVGRFINADDVTYISPETINGLNLYAYCGNNPVMRIDPNGTFFWFFFAAIMIGAAIGGTLNGISAYNDGQRGWGLFGAIAGGAIMGGAMGGILALGGAVGVASAGLMSFGMTAGTAFGVSLGVGAAAGMVSYSLENGLRTDREWSVIGMFTAGLAGLVKGGATFAIGFVGGKTGAFDKLALKGLLGKELVKDSISYGIAKGLLSAVMPGFLRNLFTWSSFYLGETLTKLLFISSVASGTRWLIDQIFDL